MAKDLNKVMIIGRLGTDPEMRYTPGGAAVTNFRVASGRQWKDNNGEQHDETEWFSVVAWNKLAEICNEYLTKGSRVYVEGRLETRSWDDANTGEKKYRTEIVANDMIILDSKNGESGQRYSNDDEDEAPRRQPAQQPQQPQRSQQGQRQQAQPARQQQSRAPQRKQAMPDDDSIPF